MSSQDLTIVFHFKKGCPACNSLKRNMSRLRGSIRKLHPGIAIKEYEHPNWSQMIAGNYPELPNFPKAPLIMILPSSEAHRDGNILRSKIYNGRAKVIHGKNYLIEAKENVALDKWLKDSLSTPFPDMRNKGNAGTIISKDTPGNGTSTPRNVLGSSKDVSGNRNRNKSNDIIERNKLVLLPKYPEYDW